MPDVPGTSSLVDLAKTEGRKKGRGGKKGHPEGRKDILNNARGTRSCFRIFVFPCRAQYIRPPPPHYRCRTKGGALLPAGEPGPRAELSPLPGRSGKQQSPGARPAAGGAGGRRDSAERPGMVELVDGLLRFGQAALGAGVVVARRFAAQVGTERADNLQPAGTYSPHDASGYNTQCYAILPMRG